MAALLSFGIMLTSFTLVITLLSSSGVYCAISFSESSCNSVFLLLVSRHRNGTQIATTDGKGHVIADINVEGHVLPSECEQKEFCRDLTVLNRSQSRQYVAFVPGISSVLILDVRLIGKILSVNDYYRKDVPGSAGCSEVGVFTLRESVFVSCLNAAEGYLEFMLLKLNASDIKGSTISAPVTKFFYDVQDHISNFVTVAVGSNPDAQQIYFQTGPYLYYCTPLSYSCNSDPIAILPNCPYPYRLEYPSGNTMMLYCKDAFVVYVDIQEAAVLNVSSNVEFGRPYVCADRNVRLVVFKSSSNYVQYGVWSQGGGVKNVTLRGQYFESGVCVQANERTLFVYVDKVDGVYVTDVVSETARLLVDRGCLSNSSFHPLSIVEDRLVVKEAGCGQVSLFDLRLNVTRIFEVEYSAETTIELVLTAQGDADCSVTEPEYQGGRRLPSTVSWVGILIGAGVLVVIVVALIIIFFFCSKRRKQLPLPVQEEGIELIGLTRDNPERNEARQDFRDPHSPPIQETNSEEYSDSGWGSEIDHPAGDEVLVGAARNTVLQHIAFKTVQLMQRN